MALESASPSEKILLMKKQLFALMVLWGMELEPFEVRVIQNLIDKLSVTDRAGSKMYWKLHYKCVIN